MCPLTLGMAMNDQRTCFSRPRPGGVVLLEVIFALALFVGGASVILGGLSSSVQSAMRLQAEAVADDLVVTLTSEIRMQLVPIADDGPNEYDEPYLGWTWEIVISEFQDVIDTEGPQMTRVEIIVSNQDAGCKRRLTLLMPVAAEDESVDDQMDMEAESDGGMGL